MFVATELWPLWLLVRCWSTVELGVVGNISHQIHLECVVSPWRLGKWRVSGPQV